MKFKALTALLLATAINPAFSDSDIRYGWNPNYSLLTVNDPDGDAKSANEFEILSASILLPLSRDSRILSTIKLYDFKVSASTNEIGQKVKNNLISAYYQQQFKVSRHFKPWLGVGLTYNADEYTNRHLVDSDGFLVTTFNNRQENNLSLGLSASIEWGVSRNLLMGINAEYHVPFNDTLEGLVIGFSLYY